jgi:hypothetical protein
VEREREKKHLIRIPALQPSHYGVVEFIGDARSTDTSYMETTLDDNGVETSQIVPVVENMGSQHCVLRILIITTFCNLKNILRAETGSGHIILPHRSMSP